jgi:hypothetical protein
MSADQTRIAHLERALAYAREKLVLYRQVHSGEYIGGMEFTSLIRLIDEAVKSEKL